MPDNYLFMELGEDDDRFHQEPGYIGWFTREQAEGAIPNGRRVEKWRRYAVIDSLPIGSQGVILGSIAVPERLPDAPPSGGFMYFVEWDARPRMPTLTAASKIREVGDA